MLYRQTYGCSRWQVKWIFPCEVWTNDIALPALIFNHYTSHIHMNVDRNNTRFDKYLSKCRFLVSKPHNEDAVSLSDAALSPWGHTAVRLIQHYTIDVLLLSQPTWQPVLMDTRERDAFQITMRHENEWDMRMRRSDLAFIYLSKAEAPSLSLMISLVSSRVGPDWRMRMC